MREKPASGPISIRDRTLETEGPVFGLLGCQHNGAEPHDTNNVMTDTPHTPRNNPGGETPREPAKPRSRSNTATRRARIRGCGVPPNIWFSPHTAHHEKTQENPASASARKPGWALEEIIRQFTEPGQGYIVTRIHPHHKTQHETVSETRATRTAENVGEKKQETSTGRAEIALEIVLADTENAPGHISADSRKSLAENWGVYLESVVETAKTRLPDGGTLAIIPPRPTPGEGFLDLSGPTIRIAREKGFSYLQHIALVDAHIAEEGITPRLSEKDLEAYASSREHGIAIHARAHSDLLIFRKPEKEPTPLD